LAVACCPLLDSPSSIFVVAFSANVFGCHIEALEEIRKSMIFAQEAQDIYVVKGRGLEAG